MTQLKLVGSEGEQKDLLEGVAKDPVLEIFEFWKVLMDKSHAQLGPKRRRAITEILRMGYSFDEIRLAIVGCKYDAWSQGSNDRNRAYNDIELICRDETKLDDFIELGNEYMKRTANREKAAAEAAEPGVPMPPAVRARLDALFSKFKERK